MDKGNGVNKYSLLILDKGDFRKDADCLNLNNIAGSMEIARTADVIFLNHDETSSILKDRTGLLQWNLLSRHEVFSKLESQKLHISIIIDKFLFIKKYIVCFENKPIYKTISQKKANDMLFSLQNVQETTVRNIVKNV